jgi:hypothetical protein
LFLISCGSQFIKVQAKTDEVKRVKV